jgi:hypothetical protein
VRAAHAGECWRIVRGGPIGGECREDPGQAGREQRAAYGHTDAVDEVAPGDLRSSAACSVSIVVVSAARHDSIVHLPGKNTNRLPVHRIAENRLP